MAARISEQDTEKSLEAQKVGDLHVEHLKSFDRSNDNEVDYSGATSKTKRGRNPPGAKIGHENHAYSLDDVFLELCRFMTVAHGFGLSSMMNLVGSQCYCQRTSQQSGR